MHKQQQLAERGAQSMLLVVLTASHGEGACVVGGERVIFVVQIFV